jgi:hypothetical protein
VKIVSVNGSPAVCSERFGVEVTPREFTRAFTAGAKIEAAATAAVGLAGSAGVGFGISIDERPNLERTKLSIDRSINGAFGGQAGISSPKAKVLLPGARAQIGASAKASLLGTFMMGDTHEFAYAPGTAQLPQASSVALGGLILSTLSVANTNNPLLAKILEAIASTTNYDDFLTTDTMALGIEASGGAEAAAVANLGSYDKTRGRDFSDIKYGVGGTAGVGVNASATISLDLKHKDLELVPGFSVKAGADVGGAIGVGSTTYQLNEEQQEKFLKLHEKLKAGIKGSISGSWKAKLALDATRDYQPKKLSFSIATEKGWGWQAAGKVFVSGPVGSPEKSTQSYTFTDREAMEKAIDRLLSIEQLANVARTAASPAGVILGPTQLAVELAGLYVTLVEKGGEYDVTAERGNGVVLPIGIELGAGARVEASAAVNFDRSLTFALEKGVIRNGDQYTLERYRKDELIPDLLDTSDLSDVAEIVQESVNGIVAAAGHAVDVVTRTVQQGVNTIRSNNTAELVFDGGTATFTDIAIASFTYDPVAGPVAPGVRLPGDVTGPADAPHFGIGGFHQFTPKNAPLTAPATLTFYYKDEEVAGLDESTLAIYAWNESTANWDFVGGAVNAAANTITTTVSRLGLFTAAPPMPGSRFTFAAQSSAAGTPEQPKTRVTYTSSPIRLNTGAQVPDGTVFTVRALFPQSSELLPFGEIATADADPLLDGVQVVASGGRVTFTAEFPGTFGVARVLVNATRGVAQGDQVIPYQ